jgi:hypothetical protein
MIAVFAPEVAIVSNVNFRKIFGIKYDPLKIKPKKIQCSLDALFHDRITGFTAFNALLILWKLLKVTKNALLFIFLFKLDGKTKYWAENHALNKLAFPIS